MTILWQEAKLFLKISLFFIYFWLALGLCRCAGLSLVAASGVCSLVAGLLWLRTTGSRAWVSVVAELEPMSPVVAEFEPVSPVLAGGFSTTAPPGRPQ